MKKYEVYSARLQSNQPNKLVRTLQAADLKEAKQIMSGPISAGGSNLNPFYCVFVNVTNGAFEIEYNQHLPFCK